MGIQSVIPALIATLTTIAVFVLKDWLFVDRQRRLYAKRLLIHCCRTLLRILEMNPVSADYLKITAIESYIDVYLKHPDLDSALDCYLDTYFSWRNGMYLSAAEAVIEDAKRDLLYVLERIDT
jgi:hypothetical protein